MEIEEAVGLLCENTSEINRTEVRKISESLGFIIAENICADMDQPPFDRSPLDGFAVKGEATKEASEENPVSLKVIAKVCAGDFFEQELYSGEAVRIMTGAPIPKGADAVIRQEDTDMGAETVRVFANVRPWQNYCYAGEDYKAGDVLIAQGTILNAGAAAVLSSLGKTEVRVYKKPDIAVVATGDEVIQPGRPLIPGKIYDSNLSYITSRLVELGVPAAFAGHVQDDAYVMAETIKELSGKNDFIITTGGVSVGEKDIMHRVVEILGVQKLFWGIRIKPGMPTLAFVYHGVLVLALSGNPYGAIANFEILGRKVLAKLCRNENMSMRICKAELMNSINKGPGTRRFLRGYVRDGKAYINNGNHSSGAVSSIIGANCLIEIRPDMASYDVGAMVNVYML